MKDTANGFIQQEIVKKGVGRLVFAGKVIFRIIVNLHFHGASPSLPFIFSHRLKLKVKLIHFCR